MNVDQLHRYLDDPAAAAAWLGSLGLVDPARAHQNLVRIATSGVTLDLLAVMCSQLEEHLPASSDADMALNNLERFVSVARNPLSLASLFERDRDALPILLQIFASSQHLSDVLVTDGESYDLLRITEGQPVARESLVAEFRADLLRLADDEPMVSSAIRRFKRRETLRVGYGDIIRGQSLDVVTRQISYVADAIVEAAVAAAARRIAERTPSGRAPAAGAGRFVVLALGKLGGCELNYSSDIDLIFLYDCGRGADTARAAQSDRISSAAGARRAQAADRGHRAGRGVSGRLAAAPRWQGRAHGHQL